MSLAYGRDILSIPGPSIIPDRVLQAMHRPAPNIYEGDLIDLTARIKTDLQAVARTKGEALIYDEIDFGTNAPIDPQKVEDALRADKNHEIKAVITVQTDTASSIKNDIPALRKAMNAAKHPALLMVDCIACLACDEYHMDDWGVDVTVSACQKGLMTPPGLAFNHISEKAWEARQRCEQTTGYWDWSMRRSPDVYYMNFYGTAPTHHLFGLGTALDMLLREEGLENVWKRHEVHANAVWAAIDAWGTAGQVACNVSALGSARESGMFRIGHMGHLSPPMILGTLATIDAGLKALNIPHGDGALDAATQVIASAKTTAKIRTSTEQECC